MFPLATQECGAVTRGVFLDSALRYAKNGWPVFPVHGVQDGHCTCSNRDCVSSGKHPRLPGGFLIATTNTEQVFRWWTQWPNANIATVPGSAGFIVIDVDGPAGAKSLDTLSISRIPTLICRTGRLDGGHHRYFHRPNDRVGNASIGQNLDVRCDAGYVILPPSRHRSGAGYRWIGRLSEVAMLPESIRIRMTLPPSSDPSPGNTSSTLSHILHPVDKRVRAYLSKLGNRAEGDGRNNASYQLSAWLTADMAIEPDLAWTYVVEWNSTNLPPLTTKELRSSFRSATKTAKRMKGSANRATAALSSLPLACLVSPTGPGMWR